MALTLLQIGQLYDDLEFRTRIKGALIWAASAVRSEAASTPNHDSRLAFGKRILADPNFVVAELLPAVVSDEAIAGSTALTDAASLTDAQFKALMVRVLKEQIG